MSRLYVVLPEEEYKSFSRRQFLHAAGFAAVLTAYLDPCLANEYPSRPVHIVLGFPPGGSGT